MGKREPVSHIILNGQRMTDNDYHERVQYRTDWFERMGWKIHPVQPFSATLFFVDSSPKERHCIYLAGKYVIYLMHHSELVKMVMTKDLDFCPGSFVGGHWGFTRQGNKVSLRYLGPEQASNKGEG